MRGARSSGVSVRRAAVVAMLGVAVVGAGPASARAAAAACQAWDTTSGAPPTDLTSALAAAAPGDTIAVSGVCSGHWELSKDVTLVRRSSPSVAVLVGDATNPVLLVDPGVTSTITGLTVKQGQPGSMDRGTLTLKGNTVIRDNAGTWGGVYVSNGTLHVTGSTLITANSAGRNAGGSGRGIFAYQSTTTVNGNAHINGNTAPLQGGGDGGGILIRDGSLTIAGFAQVNGNTAVGGSGLFLVGGRARR